MSRKNVPTGNSFGEEFGYSRAVRVGDHIHVAGTCAQPPHDHGDAYQQARSALAIIEDALAKLGASLEDVVRTVVYITDTDHGRRNSRPRRDL